MKTSNEIEKLIIDFINVVLYGELSITETINYGYDRIKELEETKTFSLEELNKIIELAREGNFSGYEYHGYVDWNYSKEDIEKELVSNR